MMDLSDGLGADLPRLAKASGVGFEVDEQALPRARGCSIDEAINDGEDYELLFALSPNDAAFLQKKWRKKFPRLPLTRIGRLTRHSSPQFLRRGGLVTPSMATFTSKSVARNGRLRARMGAGTRPE